MFLLPDSTTSMVRMFVINNAFAVNYLRMLASLVPRFLLVCLYRSSGLLDGLVSREIKVVFPFNIYPIPPDYLKRNNKFKQAKKGKSSFSGFYS